MPVFLRLRNRLPLIKTGHETYQYLSHATNTNIQPINHIVNSNKKQRGRQRETLCTQLQNLRFITNAVKCLETVSKWVRSVNNVLRSTQVRHKRNVTLTDYVQDLIPEVYTHTTYDSIASRALRN